MPRFTLLLSLSFLLLLSTLGNAGEAPKAGQVDQLSGLTWRQLEAGNIPQDDFWDYVRPQQEYLQRTYGPDVSCTYDLFLKEVARLDAGKADQLSENIIAMKTLRRWPDPVILHGSDLKGWTGRRLSKLRVYACHVDRFVPIPYQFDEVTPDGRKVLPDGGPESNPEEGDGMLDGRDVFLFMAHDLGDRVRPGDWLSRFKTALEIAVRNPLDGTVGWCYLVEFSENVPARSPLNYTSYNEKYNQHYLYYVFDQTQFRVVNGGLYRQIFTQRFQMPDYTRGNFSGFGDSLKYRTRVRLFFGALKLVNKEDNVQGNTLALRDGPVRCNRRAWGQIHLPLGLKMPRIVSDVVSYDTMFVCPVDLSVPFNPGIMLTDFSMYAGTDLSPEAYGGRWYNSNNPQGFLIDGRQSPEEKHVDETIDQWRLATGPFGTMMIRSLWDAHFLEQASVRIEFTDDITKKDPPERYPGQIGMAYNWSTVKSLEPGVYKTELDWYFPPRYNGNSQNGEFCPEDTKAYLDIYDYPIEISTGGPWFPNQPRPKGPAPHTN